MDDSAIYNSKHIDLRQKMSEISHGMKYVQEFNGMVSIPRFSQPADISKVPRTQTLVTFLSKSSPSSTAEFEPTSFNDPFYIAYSSGTTGTPKCIVHRIGGSLLSVAKEGKLHRELDSSSTILQYTTTGWIMYYSTIASLLPGSRVVLYDGSPFIGKGGKHSLTAFIELAGEQKVTMLGTSPRWMNELHRNGVVPQEVTDLSNLKSVTSTGMVLSDQLFEWFYDVGFPKHVQLANISGGTDIVSSTIIMRLAGWLTGSKRLGALAKKTP